MIQHLLLLLGKSSSLLIEDALLLDVLLHILEVVVDFDKFRVGLRNSLVFHLLILLLNVSLYSRCNQALKDARGSYQIESLDILGRHGGGIAGLLSSRGSLN